MPNPFSSARTPDRRIRRIAIFHLTVFFILLYLPGARDASVRSAHAFFHPLLQQPGSPPKIQIIGEIEPGKPIEKELAGGQTHSYHIALLADQFLHVVVEQRGIDIETKVFGPDGKQIIEIDRPNGTQGPEPVYIVATSAGNYRLEIRPSEEGAKPGGYKLLVAELREATLQDRNRSAAQASFAEGKKLRMQNTRESRQDAIKKYEESLPLWRSVADRLGEADTLFELGKAYRLSDPLKAIEYYKQALPLWHPVDDLRAKAETVNNIGSASESAGKVQDALDYFNQALPLWRMCGDHSGEVATLNNLGTVYNRTGQPQKAFDCYNQALSLARSIGERNDEARTLLNIGGAYSSLGESQKALDYYNQALPILRAVQDHEWEDITLNNIGMIYNSIGESREALSYLTQALELSRVYGGPRDEASKLNNIGQSYLAMSEPQKTLDYHYQALQLRRKIRDLRGEAISLDNIGGIYLALGDLPRALDYYQQALPLQREIRNRGGEAVTLNNLGRVHHSPGEREKALHFYQQSLQLWREVKDVRGEGRTLGNIARSLLSSGNKEESLSHFTQALQLARAAGDRQAEGTSLAYMGDIYAAQGQEEKASDSYQQALALNRAIQDRSQEAITLKGIARFERNRGNLDAARAQIDDALKIIESLRTNVANQELRSSYFAGVQSHYEFYVDLLMRLHKEHPTEGYEAAALEGAQRAHARNLLDLLTEARVNIREGADPALLDREQSIQQRLNAKAEALRRLKSQKRPAVQAAAAEKEAATLEKEIDRLAAEFHQVQAEIRLKSPRYAELLQPQPLKLTEIRRQILDPDSLLLEYSLGEERSYLWAVTLKDIASYELPARAKIEDAAERLSKLLSVPRGRRTSDAESQRRLRIEMAKLDADTRAAATELSRMLLAPVAEHLGTKRLVIVGDGRLQYIPFAVLPDPVVGKVAASRRKQITAYRPLIVDHEIVSLPSASTLAVLRRDLAGRTPAPRMVRAFADPVFDVCDDRFVERDKCLAQNDASAQPAPVDISAQTRAIQSLRDANVIRRLRRSKDEAEFIAKLAPAGSSKVSYGFEASLASATSAEMAQYRYVHFATHGWLDDKRPELTGVLLSLVDDQGREQNGLLRLGEVYNLKLPAEVVTLSACETALGKDVRGEGLVGLTRGFMYAGAARVVASLWKVEEDGTKELMKRFYSGMLGKKPLRPAAALRQAQISMLRDPRWRSPYYWGAFILQGEWR